MSARQLDDPDMPVAEIMRTWPMTVPVFIAHGMFCVGCMIGPFHTLQDACLEYGIDHDTLLAELRAAVRVAAGQASQGGAAGSR